MRTLCIPLLLLSVCMRDGCGEASDVFILHFYLTLHLDIFLHAYVFKLVILVKSKIQPLCCPFVFRKACIGY